MMRLLGMMLSPVSLVLGMALLVTGGRGNAGYSIAGAILIGSVLVSGSIPSGKDRDGK